MGLRKKRARKRGGGSASGRRAIGDECTSAPAAAADAADEEDGGPREEGGYERKYGSFIKNHFKDYFGGYTQYARALRFRKWAENINDVWP